MTPEILAQCRAEIEANLPDSALVKLVPTGDDSDEASNSDGMGGTSSDIGGSTGGYTDGPTYRCRVTLPTLQNRSAEIGNNDLMTSITDAVIILPWNAGGVPAINLDPEIPAIRLQDRLEITDGETGKVTLWEVKRILPHSNSISFHVLGEIING
jgi:hypothetical protein